MTWFTKRPVDIQAWDIEELMDQFEDRDELPKEIEEAYRAGDIKFTGTEITVVTLEGSMSRHDGMLIRGVEGEFYPCDPVIFMKTYHNMRMEK